MGKGKDKDKDAPRSPKGRFTRQVITRDVPAFTVTPYPLSTSTEMAMAMAAEADNIKARVSELVDSVQRLQARRERSQPTLDALNAVSERLVAEGVVTPATRSQLKKGYVEDQTNCQEELALAQETLRHIYALRDMRTEMRNQAKSSGNKETFRRGALMKMLLNTAQTLPLFLGAEPPPLCGRLPPEPSYIVPVGDMAACLVRGSEGEENWILAEIRGYVAASGKYEVEDIDEEQEEQRERHTLSRRKVYPLPLWRANPQVNPEALYSEGASVMALYPQTTCFYKAVVSMPPSLAVEDYSILFEDPSYPDGYSPALKICQRYVLPYKDAGKK